MSEWWEFKLSPLLAVFYATAVITNTPLLDNWVLPLLLLLSLAVGAIYVSVINDLSDIETDQLAGKTNRFANKSFAFKTLVLSICLMTGILTNYFWFKTNWLVGGFYLAAWIAYTLYSIPPFRFKNKGFLGVLGDATGAHFFPYLFVVSATFNWIGTPLNLVWLITVGIWALSCGLRGILWHQVQDYQSDLKSKVNTFVTKNSKSTACLIGERIIFPIELISFILLLIISQNIFGVIFLVFYFGLIWSRSMVWDLNIVIIAPHPNYQIIMNDFYAACYPLSILLLAALAHPNDLLIGLLHFSLFPKTIISMTRDFVVVIIDAVKQNRTHSYPTE